MEKDSRILVLDARNMVGKAIKKRLEAYGYTKIYAPTEEDLDIMNPSQVKEYFLSIKPEYVFCFAGPHGGIYANITYPADFIYENLVIEANIIHNSYLAGVKKLIFMAGGCVYPRDCAQPIKESCFMTGKMEPTSAAYSTARAAGMEMCLAYNRQYGTSFIPAPLSNYYGPEDDISEKGHVLASVMYKMHQAKIENLPSIELFGTGKPLRQFLYIDDIADAAVYIMNHLKEACIINIAGGQELSIQELAAQIRDTVGYQGEILFDTSKQDGAMRKLLDDSQLSALGWKAATDFKEGLKRTYQWFLDTVK